MTWRVGGGGDSDRSYADGWGTDQPRPPKLRAHVPQRPVLSPPRPVLDPGPVAVGTWSGGRFMRFGEPLDDRRFISLISPDDSIRTVITADVYGTGEADEMLGRAITGRARDEICVVGAIGHDFYTGERDGAKGFPRFTDPRLRTPSEYGDYLRMATERSLTRCGIGSFDLLLLHNPDRIGYTSEAVWNAMAALRDEGLARMIGVAPGPANGFTLDLIDCLERFGALIDWAMIILNPLEPWPGEMCLAAAANNEVKVITRVVDYGGLFFDDVLPGQELFPRPPQLPAAGLDRGGSGTTGVDLADRAACRADLDPTRLSVEPRSRCSRLRRADPDSGGWGRCASGGVQACRGRRAAVGNAALRSRRRGDQGDWRQRRLYGAEGR